ncbi:MAG: hypothetical protein Ta2B_00110 [Termitinemataceae bacterium]|nr:MAG: hypothetical protein Ta2B_00110 [Termitinemataceae bacterium]
MNKYIFLLTIFLLSALGAQPSIFSQEDEDDAGADMEGMEFEDILYDVAHDVALPIEAKPPEGPQIDVYAEVSTEFIEQNVPFSITVMVNHPNPVDVHVQPPDFEENFTMERVLTEVKLVKVKERWLPWTRFEFLLMPLNAGSVYLGSFEVAIPGRTAATRRMRLKINNEKSGKSGRLQWIGQNIWNGPPSVLYVGHARDVGLRLLDVERGRAAPKQLPLRIEAPENAVIEELPITAPDRELGIYFRMRILPLDERDVKIAAHTFRFEGRTLVVPALNIKVQNPPLTVTDSPEEILEMENNPVEHQDFVPQISQDSSETDTKISMPKIQFPKYAESRFLPMSYRNTIKDAQIFWQAGDYAESLLVLRKGERELACGMQLRILRKTAEVSLGIPNEPNEQWHPRSILYGIGLASFVALLCSIIFIVCDSRKKQKNEQKPKRRNLSPAGAFIFVLAIIGFWIILPDMQTSAITKQTFAQPLPEQGPQIEIPFLEGQKVKVRVRAKEWIYIESYDGKSGWVTEDKIIFY